MLQVTHRALAEGSENGASYHCPVSPHLAALGTNRHQQKEIGSWNQLQFLQGAEAWSMSLLTQVYGWTSQEVSVQVAQVRNDAQNMRIHAYYNM